MKHLLICIAGLLLLSSCTSTEPAKNVNMDEAVKSITESVEFPVMMQVEDAVTLQDVIKLDLNEIQEYRVYQQMISVNLNEIIFIKPKEGKADSVLEKLNARKQALKDLYAFYPAQQTAAENTVTGKYGDYVYLICHEQAQRAQQALIEYIEKA